MSNIKHTLILCLGVLLGMTAFGSAEAQFHWGVRAGADFSKFPTTADQFKSDYYTGFHVGPTVEMKLPLRFSLDASLLFSQKNVGITSMEKTEVKDILKTNYFVVPVNAKFDLVSLPGADVMVIAGPQFNFMLNNNLEDLKDLNALRETEAKKASVGVNVGLGVRVLKMLQISALYNATLSDDYKFTSLNQTTQDVFNAKTNSFVIQAAVLF
ncbi:outer membrane beta-barrel protein [uncultured Porphyromonas sp.]|uniref:outer membrane beta-barrel protein n=1 Tax=uncultured Porphyromonas sp. TaxID=159274 RepID=UPI002593F2E6|nr:outer membrane beta-barrel protein [uncultured Porphyromonas sp.]